MDSIDNGMLGFVKCTVNEAPIFYGQIGMSYEIWSNMMKIFL
jgi:hypothetical protein